VLQEEEKKTAETEVGRLQDRRGEEQSEWNRMVKEEWFETVTVYSGQ